MPRSDKICRISGPRERVCDTFRRCSVYTGSIEFFCEGCVPRPGLSKSKLLSFLQCPKRLWLEVHRPDAAEFSTEAERGFAVGYSVGEVARQLVPGGVLIGGDNNLADALAETQKQISAGAETLFESTFEHEGVLVRADILTRRARGAFEITEATASTGVKDYQ